VDYGLKKRIVLSIIKNLRLLSLFVLHFTYKILVDETLLFVDNISYDEKMPYDIISHRRFPQKSYRRNNI